MTSYIRKFNVPERIFGVPELEPQNAVDIPDRSALGAYGTLVQKLIQVRQEQTAGLVTTFTSVSHGEGVTSVIDALAWELTRYSGQAVLVTSPAALAGAQHPFRVNEPIDPRKVWRLGPSMTGHWHRHPDDSRAALRTVQERFGFILVDCPPLSNSSAIFSAAAISDGLVLVVAAGQSKRRDIEEARRLLSATSVPTLGIVLNKHRDSAPKMLSAFF